MASFNTHLGFSTAASGMLATATLSAGLSSPLESVSLWIVGALGGLLPDIDSDTSSSLKLVFNAISMLIAATLVMRSAGKMSLTAIWVSVFIFLFLMRTIVLTLFQKLTVHRGNWHSLLALVLVAELTVVTNYYLIGSPAQLSWLSGIFIGTGYLVHLLLDEFCSIDLSGMRVNAHWAQPANPAT